MLTLRKSAERGHADHGWLQSRHSFSFADYHDPAHMGWGNLRVINEDWIAPGQGFGTHGHRDMEIVTYVLEGALAHRDSLGNGEPGGGASGRIEPGDVQRMSAGTGVRHSEFNPSVDRPTHLFQIWILPDRAGIEPGYEQVRVEPHAKRGRLALIAAPPGENGAVTIHADARLLAGLFESDERHTHALAPGRLGYVLVARGQLRVNGHALSAGDALLLRDEPAIELDQGRDAEALVFDLRA